MKLYQSVKISLAGLPIFFNHVETSTQNG